MTTIIPADRSEFSIDPAILDLLPTQGSVELQRDAAGKVAGGGPIGSSDQERSGH